MKKFDKYRDYLRDYLIEGTNAKTADMSAAGWKMLIEEAVGPLIEQELGMRYLGNRIWASDYQEHCRKVFGMFLVNPYVATFKWGWNFDFIPMAKMNATKACYARTDKTIQYHFYEVPEDFYRGTDNSKYTKINAFRFDVRHFEKAVEKRIGQHRDVFRFVLPEIRAFYENTSDYEKKLETVKAQQENFYYRFINPDLILVQIFLEYYLGDTDNAKKYFENLKFKKETLRDSFYDKLLRVEPREV